jgi:hypothetical protein
MNKIKQCPQCGQLSVQVRMLNGRERAMCGSCNWNGPKCYGDKWVAHDPVCVGGNDKTYWDKARQTHQRPQCGVYQICAAEMNRQKISGLTPMTSLIQQQQMTPPPAVQAQMAPPPVVMPMPDGTRRQVAVAPPMGLPRPIPPISTQMRSVPVKAVAPPAQAAGMQPMVYQQQHAGMPMMVMMVPPDQAQTPALVPQNVVQPGTQVMAIITVPEQEDLPYFKRFAGSVGRSMLKYGFLSAAGMMDHVPWWR